MACTTILFIEPKHFVPFCSLNVLTSSHFSLLALKKILRESVSLLTVLIFSLREHSLCPQCIMFCLRLHSTSTSSMTVFFLYHVCSYSLQNNDRMMHLKRRDVSVMLLRIKWHHTFVTLLLQYTIATYVSALSVSTQSPILVIGATGSMGARALAGFLDVGYKPGQLRLLTRNETKAHELRNLGFDVAVADLDITDNNKPLDVAVEGCHGCYIHSTSSDTRKLDTKEVDRAITICKALLQNNVRNIVFNSAAGEKEHGVRRIQQKHDVENIFIAHEDIFFISLRANLFMDELWKGYTRPSILKGTYPFMVPSDRPIYLTSVRDMGRLAGTILKNQQTKPSLSKSINHRIMNVAGDVLTPKQIAEAFAKEQKSPCHHKQSRVFALLVRLFFRDLYEIITFYRNTSEKSDIHKLNIEFPSLLTTFPSFLSETNWVNRDLSFASLQALPILAEPEQETS